MQPHSFNFYSINALILVNVTGSIPPFVNLLFCQQLTFYC